MLSDAMPASDQQTAFPTLTTEQIEALRPYGTPEDTERGQVLVAEGDRGFDFFVVLEGAVEITERSGGDESRITLHEAGEFTGDVDMLTGRAALFTATAREAGRVLRLCSDCIQRVIAEEPDLSDPILRAFLMRRTLLLEGGFTGVQIVGSRFSPGTGRLKAFAARNQLPFTWLDLEEDEGAETLLEQFGIAPEETPVVVCRGEEVLRNPSNAELAECMGLPGRPNGDSASDGDVRDLIVVGAGPAGLAAAVYGASEGLSTLCLEASAPGGQASASSKIENYLGFPTGLPGAELARRARLQAQKFGARLTVPCEVTGLRSEAGGAYHVAELSSGDEAAARAFVAATGATYRKLPLERLASFEDTGVYYAATQMEARLCTGEDVVVVGGGNSAGQAAMFLAERARHVYVLVRSGDGLEKSMSRYLSRRVERQENVEVLLHTEAKQLEGDPGQLEAVHVKNNETGETERLAARALFVMIGAEPNAGWLPGHVATDADGFVLSGEAAAARNDAEGFQERAGREPGFLETSVPGLFAAGDVRSGSIKRVASAVGEGAMGVKLVHQHLADTA